MQPGVSSLDVRPLSLMYRALGDETRLRMVALLVHGELCVCHIEKGLGISQPNASRQLGILRSAGIVDYRRDGSWVYYFIKPGNHEMIEAQLEFLMKQFGSERTLKADHARVRKSCGPEACR